MEKTEKRAFVALNDSMSSKAVIDYIINMSLSPEKWHLCLVHILRNPSASEELMGKKFTREQPTRMLAMLEKAKARFVANGFSSDRVHVEVSQLDYSTVTDSIINQFKKQPYDMLIIGRKRMSKAEEFVMGDISIKLIRMLERTAVLVVKS